MSPLVSELIESAVSTCQDEQGYLQVYATVGSEVSRLGRGGAGTCRRPAVL